MPLKPLVDELVSQQSSPLTNLFSDAQARPPVAIWSPGPSALSHPMLLWFSRLVNDIANSDGTLDALKLNLHEFGELADWIMLMKYGKDDALFFEHFGKGISAIRGFNMGGMEVPKDQPTIPEPHIDTFYRAVLEAIRLVRQPLLTEHQPPSSVFLRQWRRLIYPLTEGPSEEDDPKPISGYIYLAYADNELSPGLESLSDPVVIIDADHRVMFANRQARQLFHCGRFAPWGINLFDFAGIELSISVPPTAMFESGRTLTFKSRHVAHSILSHVVTLVSGLRHNGQDYYLLNLRFED